MIWCSCYHEDGFLDNIIVNYNEPVKCVKCGNFINIETIIISLLEETRKLRDIVQELKQKKLDRELEKEREEAEREFEELMAMKKMEKGTERFNILDL